MVTARLPRHHIFELATPLIVYNGHLLQCMDGRGEDGYLELAGRRHGLAEIAQTRILEDLYLAHNSEAADAFKQEAAHEHADRQYTSMQEMRRDEGRNRVLSLILDDILPQLSGQAYTSRLEEALGEPSGNGRHDGAGHVSGPDLESRVNEMTPEMRRQARRMVQRVSQQVIDSYEGYRLPSDPIESRVARALEGGDGLSSPLDDSVLFECVGNTKVMVMDGDLYHLDRVNDFLGLFRDCISPSFYQQLMRAPATKRPDRVLMDLEENRDTISHSHYSRIINKIAGSKVKINRTYYIPLLWDKAEELEKRYMRLTEKHLILEAIEESLTNDRRLYELAQESRRFEDIERRGRFEENGAGVFRHDRRWYAFMKTPEYALKSPHIEGGRCYVPFPAATIAVPIDPSNGPRGSYRIGNPVIAEAYRHPFTGTAPPMHGICFGRWSPERVLRSSLAPDQKVVRLLNQAKETLMMGYRSGENPYIPLMPGNWDSWMDKNEVERRGLVCLNDFRR